MLSQRILRTVSRALVGTLALAATSAFAGMPLICHPYAIGSAKTLPGSDGEWKGVNPQYERKNLERDTLALLTPETPILVRMETIRRAAIYATANMRGWSDQGGYTADDRAVAMGLLEKLRQRTTQAKGPALALALFDLGFYTETLRQTRLDPALDGYPLLVHAAELRGPDPEVELALALASTHPKRPEHADHLARARAGAKPGSSLATNLNLIFSRS